VSRALIMLIGLRHIGAWRAFLRSGRGSALALVGKVICFAYVLGIWFLWAAGVRFALATPANHPARLAIRSFVADYGRLAPIPFFLLLVLVAVFAVFQRPFHFSPPEVDFVTAGPFSRRQALNFKIGAEFLNLVVIALLAAPIGAAVFSFHSVFAGMLLLLTFLSLFGLVVGSLGTMLRLGGTSGPVRLVLMLGLLGASCALVWFSFGPLRNDPAALYRRATTSLGWRVALAPLRGFFEVMMARRFWTELVPWTALCLVIDGALLGAVYALDARLERRDDESDERTIEVDHATPAAARALWSLPLPAWGHGAGPLAWRQAMDVVRAPQQLGFAIYLNGMLLGLTYMGIKYCKEILIIPTFDGHLDVNPVGVWICGVLALIVPMLITSALSFDFRGDAGRLEILKALPITPLAVVAGQLAVPVMIATVAQWLLMAFIALALQRVPFGLWVAAAFAPPVSILLIAIENLPSFWFPLRHTPGSRPEPFEQFGHVLLHPLVRMVAYAVTTIITALMAVLAFLLSGKGVVAPTIVAWLTLAAGAAALVALLSRAFDRHDVAQDTTA
jgi:hypothetical protein